MKRLTGRDLAYVEEHLLVCEECRDGLTETDEFVAAAREAARRLQEVPLDVTHGTDLGPVRLVVRQDESGEWRASVTGPGVAGAQRFQTVAEANEWVLESFRLEFPGHECDEGCG